MVQGAAVSTFYFQGSTQADADTASFDVRRFWDAIKSGFPTYGAVQIEPEVAVIDEATGTQTNVFSTVNSVVNGTNTVEGLPPMTQGLIRLGTSTVVGGHALRGRLFIPGPCEDSNDGSARPSASYRAMLGTAVDNYLIGSTVPYVVYSPTYHTFGAVTSATVWTKWAYLSSRRD